MRSQLQADLLTKLYEHFISDEGSFDYGDWAEVIETSLVDVDRAFDELEEVALVTGTKLGRYGQLTSKGVVACEVECLDGGHGKRNDEIRQSILGHLKRVRDEHGPNQSMQEYDFIARACNLDEIECYQNVEILEGAGLVESVGLRHYRITRDGMRVLARSERRDGWSRKWNELQNDPTNPQKRGHELEKLLGDVAKFEDWDVALNALAPGEENDLVISKGFTVFVVSCKWTSSVTKSSDIQSLLPRLQIRPGSYGLVASVSGFSSGALDWVSMSSMGLVVLMGPTDLESVFTLKEKLSDMMLRKHKLFMTGKKHEYR